MNCPTWLPIAASTCSCSMSGSRTARSKNSMTPCTSRPTRMGKAIAPCSPTLAAVPARRKRGSELASTSQVGSPHCQTCPTQPCPRANVASRLTASNSPVSTEGACHVWLQRRRPALASTIQSAPHAHPIPSPMARRSWGAASVSVIDSARLRVTACSVISRCSLRCRSATSASRCSLARVRVAVRSRTVTSRSSSDDCGERLACTRWNSPSEGPLRRARTRRPAVRQCCRPVRDRSRDRSGARIDNAAERALHPGPFVTVVRHEHAPLQGSASITLWCRSAAASTVRVAYRRIAVSGSVPTHRHHHCHVSP